MIELSNKYPEYHFESHVGYGTAAHRQALLEHGIRPEHRQSFRPIREIVNQFETSIVYDQPQEQRISPTCATAVGQAAECAIIDFLQAHDHTIIAHNYKTKIYEIDIISTLEDKIYFTEVKYRQDSAHGTPLDQITSQKHTQMSYATQNFLSSHPEFTDFQPILAAGTVSGPEYDQIDWFPLAE